MSVESAVAYLDSWVSDGRAGRVEMFSCVVLCLAKARLSHQLREFWLSQLERRGLLPLSVLLFLPLSGGGGRSQRESLTSVTPAASPLTAGRTCSCCSVLLGFLSLLLYWVDRVRDVDLKCICIIVVPASFLASLLSCTPAYLRALLLDYPVPSSQGLPVLYKASELAVYRFLFPLITQILHCCLRVTLHTDS